jgi:hypothetical protein
MSLNEFMLLLWNCLLVNGLKPYSSSWSAELSELAIILRWPLTSDISHCLDGAPPIIHWLHLTLWLYKTALIKLYLLRLYAKGVKKDYQKPMLMSGKEKLSSVLPSCSICGATLDLKLLRCFGSRRIISDDTKSYYCNNPLCPPDEEERRRRLLPFSENSHCHM